MITIEAIRKLYELSEENKSGTFNVDYNVQLYKIVKQFVEKGGQRLLPVTISDGNNSMNAVLILVEDAPKEGDILHIYTVNIVTLSKKTIVVKKFEIVGNAEIIAKPIRIDISNSKPEVKVEQIQALPPAQSMMVENVESNKMNVEEKTFTPLSSLNTFIKDIHILVKITRMYPIREFNKDGNSGKLFSFNFIDAEGTEMQATAFTKGIEKHYTNLKEGHVYEIHGGYLKINDKKFSTVKSDYKIIIDDSTEIYKSNKDIDNAGNYNFVQLAELTNKPLFGIVDVMVYVLEANATIMINTKQGNQTKMRKLVCVDETEYKVEVTLWRDFTDLIIEPGDIVALKTVKVGDYGGRSLSSVDNTHITINPPHSDKLKAAILDKQSYGLTFKPIQSKMASSSTSSSDPINATYLRDVINEYEAEDKCPSSKIKATILTMKHDDKNYYTGCDNCKKKISKDNEKWVCQNCNKEYESPSYYYTLSLKVKDASVEAHIDFFGQVAEKLLNMACVEYKHLIDTKDEVRLKEISGRIEFKTFNMVVKPKRSTYNNVAKIRINCFKTLEIDKPNEARNIVKKLNSIIFRK
jgi:replication factor A1